MNELISKLKEAGKAEAFKSPEEFTAAAKALGYSDGDISEALENISFPMSEDELEDIAGGMAIYRPPSSKELPVPVKKK